MRHYLCMKTGGIMTAKDDKVLGDWRVRVLNHYHGGCYIATAGTVSASWRSVIRAYRIISTGEDMPAKPEKVESHKPIVITPKVDLIGTGSEGWNKDRAEGLMPSDDVPQEALSLQEAAYAAKVAAMPGPEPEPKTVPVRCLDYVEFRNLLGMSQFVGGE